MANLTDYVLFWRRRGADAANKDPFGDISFAETEVETVQGLKDTPNFGTTVHFLTAVPNDDDVSNDDIIVWRAAIASPGNQVFAFDGTTADAAIALGDVHKVVVTIANDGTRSVQYNKQGRFTFAAT